MNVGQLKRLVFLMKKILTASTNPVVIETVRKACRTYAAYFSAEVFDATEPVISYIN